MQQLKIYFLLVMLLWMGGAQATDDTTRHEIEHLLDYVRTSDLVFIRNGKEHSPEEAWSHMQRKARYFEKKIHTAEDFIELSATLSTRSGQRYSVRLAGGEEQDSAAFLLGELSRYRESQNTKGS